MAILLRWITRPGPSCFDAAAALAGNDALADRALESALRAPVATFAGAVSREGLNVHRLLRELVPLSATIEDDADLARAAGGASLAAEIGAFKRAYFAARPQAAAELALRERPLREQWEARGPGLMARLSRRIGAACAVPRADVLLVHPLRGGGGTAHAAYNAVSFEAVLANPHARLPEVVRLGWLLARVGLEQSLNGAEFSELQPAERERLAAAALLPAILTAAEEVELVPPADSIETQLKAAVEAWRIPGVDVAGLTSWWERQERAPELWPAALLPLRYSCFGGASW